MKKTKEKTPRQRKIASMLFESYVKKVEQKCTRDIGKFLQFIAEDYVISFLKEVCNIDCAGVSNDINGNEPTWDVITHNGIRIQVKYRGGKQSGRPKLFLETTRRNSQKNAGAKGASGHVAYGSDEFDVAVFVVPTETFDYKTTKGLHVIAIPAKELVNPLHPSILLKNVPAKIIDKYHRNAKEVLCNLE